MTRNLSKSLIAQRKKSEPFRKTLYGSLGIPLNGQKLVQVPDRQAYVYVRLNDNQNEVIQAFNNTVAPSYDLPVIVMREGGRYTVKQVNTQRYENNWNNSSPYLPSHGTAHSFYPGGGADISWIYSRQIMHGLVYPTVTGSTVDIASFPLYTPNGWVLAGATGTVNLLQYRPVSGSAALMMLLYADSSNGNPGLLVNSGTYFAYDITGSIYPYIPRPNLATQIPLAAIRLSTGTLTVGWDNLYDVRQWIHSIPSGTSSGGGGGGIDTLGFAGLYNGIPIGTGTMMNVRGNTANFSISGAMFDLFITGSESINLLGVNPINIVVTGSYQYLGITAYPLMIGYEIGWVNTGTISVSAGSCFAPNGSYIDLANSVTIAPTISGSAWNHVYAYLSTGTVPTIEVNAVSPITWKGTAYGKTGDTSRRYLGSVLANSARNIYAFVHHVESGNMTYKLYNSAATPFRVLNGGTSTSAVAISLAPALPITSKIAVVRITNSSDQRVDVSEDTNVGATQRTPVVSLSTSSTQSLQGTYNMGMDASQQVWYRMGAAVGAGGAFIDVLGFYFNR